MRVGIIGTGAMARALGARWAASGRTVLIAGRSPSRSADAADATGARASRFGDVIRRSDILLLAVDHRAVDEVLEQMDTGSGVLHGKVLIDCTNPVDTADNRLDLPTGATSMAEYLADRTGAQVVKAFNMAQASVWERPPQWGLSQPATVLSAAADGGAADAVTALIDDLGFRSVNIGGLDRARYLEAAAAIVIGLLAAGEPSGSLLTWVRPLGPPDAP
jgi:8-hydroxy-5-deazaflavin:NADPH oxidoreductase